MNRADRRSKNRKRNPTKADAGLRAQLIKGISMEIAVTNSLVVYDQFISIALHDVYDSGKIRTQRFFSHLDELRKEYEKMCVEGDREYANAKLAEQAYRVSGIDFEKRLIK